MKAILEVKGICCPNCASKLEDRLKKIDGCDGATYAFMTQRMTLEIKEDSVERIVSEAIRVISKYEPKAEVTLKRVVP